MMYKRKTIEHYKKLLIIWNIIEIKEALTLTWLDLRSRYVLRDHPTTTAYHHLHLTDYCTLLENAQNGSNKNKTDSFGGIT